jgi:hypothetical protein
MWVFSLIASLLLHLAVLMTVGVKGGGSERFSSSAFSVVEIAPAVGSVSPVQMAADPAANADRAAVAPAANRSSGDYPAAFTDKQSALPIETISVRFYKSSEVSHVAQLQLPLEEALFSGERSLSGRLVLDIAVTDQGKVVNIDVISASDPSGALRERMLPMLMQAPFTPAYKDGRPVNSIRRVEFTLGIVVEVPDLNAKPGVAPGFRPRMDERGNISKVQPYQ